MTKNIRNNLKPKQKKRIFTLKWSYKHVYELKESNFCMFIAFFKFIFIYISDMKTKTTKNIASLFEYGYVSGLMALWDLKTANTSVNDSKLLQ